MEYSTRRIKRSYIIAAIFSLILIASSITSYIIYTNQIVSINDINIKAKQHSKVDMPKQVTVKLRNGKEKNVDVLWEKNDINTSEENTNFIEGTIKGNPKKANLNVSVVSYIKDIKKENAEIIINDKNYKLPETVEATDSNEIKSVQKVKWNEEDFKIDEAGTYEIKGTLLTSMETEKDPIFELKVISKEEVIDRILVKNGVENNDEPRAAIEKVKKLPNSVLYNLLKSNVKITYVKENIADIQSVFKIPGLTIIGYCNFNTKQIFVHYPIKSTDFINTTMVTIHEIGHAYDNNKIPNNYICITNEFLNAYREEAKIMFNPNDREAFLRCHKYYSGSPIEYFAQSFAYYFSNEELAGELKTKAPKTYKVIDEAINK